MTFSTGEARLSEWMHRTARVACHVCEEPWKLEEQLIATVDLPLNLDQNRRHGFHPELSQIRREAKARARDNLSPIRMLRPRCQDLSRAPLPLDLVLRLPLRDRLPLHIRRRIRPA